MATLTTEYQLLGEAYLGTDSYNHSLYVRIYAKYSTQEISNNRSYVYYQARTYFEGGYIIDQQGSGSVNGTSANTVSNTVTRPTTGENIIATTEGWVSHDNDGKKSISCSASLSFPNWGWGNTANGSADLPNIPRFATITDYPISFTDEENPYFKFSNPANASMSCWLEINPTGEHLATRTLSGTSGTYTWNLTETERNQLRAKTPNSNVATCRIGLYSTIGGTTSPNYKDVQYKIVNANPINPIIEILDGNSITKSLTGQTDVIVKGHSTIVLNIYPQYKAIAQKSATMKNYIFEADGKAYSETEMVTFEKQNYSKTGVKLYSVDSRGNSSLLNHTFPSNYYIDYFDITKGAISLTRGNSGVGEEVTLSYSGTFWNGNFGAANNSLTATYKYKKTTSNVWITGTTTINPTISNNDFSYNGQIAGDTQSHGFDINDSYDFEVVISDSLSTVTFSAILGSGKPAIALYGNKVALGDKYDTSLGGIQLWGDVYVNGNRIS